jgi:hypothetical protein
MTYLYTKPFVSKENGPGYLFVPTFEIEEDNESASLFFFVFIETNDVYICINEIENAVWSMIDDIIFVSFENQILWFTPLEHVEEIGDLQGIDISRFRGIKQRILCFVKMAIAHLNGQ